MPDYETLRLNNFELQTGIVLPVAELTYKTYGALSARRDNAILYPTSYGAQHSDVDWLVGAGRVLDPTRWFVIIVNQFGNGLSSSPSTLKLPFGPGRFPAFRHWDNIRAQHSLVTQHFGIERLALVYGWSMGAQQALHWGAIHPEHVGAICAVCGSARTSIHNKVFLEGVRGALTGDPLWQGDHFAGHPVRGLRAMGRVYAGWAMSQAFYRERLHETIGYAGLEDWLVRNWEANFLRRDAHDLLSMLDTWYHSDISDNEVFQGDLDAALGAITPRTMVMPSRTDLYFTPEDSQIEAAKMPNAEFRPIESIWGHRAGNPVQNPADEAVLRAAVADLTNN